MIQRKKKTNQQFPSQWEHFLYNQQRHRSWTRINQGINSYQRWESYPREVFGESKKHN